MTASVVIHGPQGCGKTINGHRLARHFGLKHVVDDCEQWNKPLATDTLFLTHEEPPPNVHRVLRVLSFAEAMRICGFARSPSQSNQQGVRP